MLKVCPVCPCFAFGRTRMSPARGSSVMQKRFGRQLFSITGYTTQGLHRTQPRDNSKSSQASSQNPCFPQLRGRRRRIISRIVICESAAFQSLFRLKHDRLRRTHAVIPFARKKSPGRFRCQTFSSLPGELLRLREGHLFALQLQVLNPVSARRRFLSVALAAGHARVSVPFQFEIPLRGTTGSPT